ncbi:hypothetical protein NQ176_g2575 [Zarea fungicola]|uniref:Uncharacterized protein n=1 Tax=Zarea fungicola TaxID=93591 RepID=A0ACC1NMJ4_9HYPO|nr:hypothetical protein NQ176_g2575 [Lecanicillium fungicola]
MKLATLIPIWVVSFTIHAAVGYSPSRSPEVQIRNGTVVGIYDRGRNQDQFLGIPFAQAPVGALRFSRPQPLEQKWSVPQDARNYGPSCLGVGIGLPGSDSNTSWPESEDCLTINVVRPTKHSCQAYPDGLPVLVWVYGGGFQQGYSGDAKYNLSHLIDMAASSEQPMIGLLSAETRKSDSVWRICGPRDAIDCLRRIPAQELASAAARVFWRPVIDYDLFSQLPSESLNQGYFIKVPILIGTNTNEGTLFLDAYRAGKPVNTREDLWMVMQANMTPFVLSNNTIDLSYQIYSELKNMSEAQLGTVVEDPGPEYGQLFGQASLILGDSMFNAGRRATCQAWTKNGVPAYSYRFDTDPAGVDPRVYGSAHFQEVAFVFANIGGKGLYTPDILAEI